MTDLRVIDGGRSLASGEAARIATAAGGAVYDVNLLRRVRLAEKNAAGVAQLMAPAFAIINSADAELAALIAADIDEAIAVAKIFAKAAAITRKLADTLESAGASLSAAIAEQAKPPIR